MTNKELNLVIYNAQDRIFDINNKYGTFWGSKSLYGCHVWAFTKGQEKNFEPYEMSEEKCGKVTVNGREIPYKWNRHEASWNPWCVTININKLGFKPGNSYEFVVSDFKTKSGETIEPFKTVFSCVGANEENPKYAEHKKKALECAYEGAVLLKNENNLLPITDKKINIFGEAYYNFFIMSSGAGCINPRFTMEFTSEIRKTFEINPEIEKFYSEDFGIIPNKDMLNRAKKFSDTAVITICRGSSESLDNNPIKGDYYLSDEEESMIKEVSEVFENTVVILNTGYTIDVKWIEKYNIKAVLWFGFGGESASKALTDILSGKVNPSGRLPDTWAMDYYDHPSSKNFIIKSNLKESCDHPHITNVYEEGLYVGYRYFDTFNVPVMYPFGFGLSYTDFIYEFSEAKYEDGSLTVSAKVTNVGDISGKYVLQLYVKEPQGKLKKVSHKFIDFNKTKELKPNESEVLNFQVKDSELSSYDCETASFIMEKGKYIVYLAEHINKLQEVYSFQVSEDKIIKKLHNYCVPQLDFEESETPEGMSYFDTEIKGFDFSKTQRKHFEVKALPKYNGDIIYYEDVEKDISLLDNFVSQMSVEELARLNVCACAWSIDVNGVAGSVYALDKYKMKHFYTADGNSCLRMKKKTTGFPSSNMICASFNRDIAYTVGEIIAKEAYEEKIHMILSPGMNIHRNPLCGRNAEYFSEDPILCGVMAGYHLKGHQDNKVGGVIKHIIANNAEYSRMRSHSIVGERTLREIYIKPFEIAMGIDEPYGLMTSYNATNDCYTACDEELMLGIFREELGFSGYIMTDWESYTTIDPVKAVASGNSWLTPGSQDDKYVVPIVEGVKNGIIELGRLQDNVKRLVSVMIKYTSLERI